MCDTAKKHVDSGANLCGLYPTGKTTLGLIQPFRQNVQKFITELEVKRGCTVKINATLRPASRAWLMYHAWMIHREGRDPATTPTERDDLVIRWTREGAAAMCATYGLVARPSLTSRHIDGRAIDMNVIGWKGTRAELEALGVSFGVRALGPSDPVHWSDDGR